MKAPYVPDIPVDANTHTLVLIKDDFPMLTEMNNEKAKIVTSLTEVHAKNEIAFMRKDILMQENSKESSKKRQLVLNTKNRKFSILAL